jgi:hypothetical protein
MCKTTPRHLKVMLRLSNLVKSHVEETPIKPKSGAKNTKIHFGAQKSLLCLGAKNTKLHFGAKHSKLDFFQIGGDETGPVLILGSRLLHLGADGLKVPRHFGATGEDQPKSVIFVTIR